MDGVLLELKVVVSHRIAFNYLIIMVRIVDLVKKGVFQHLSCRQPLLWIISHQLLDQVDRLWRCAWNELLESFSRRLFANVLHMFQKLLLFDILRNMRWRHTKQLNQVF